jgi:hypothetical protein
MIKVDVKIKRNKYLWMKGVTSCAVVQHQQQNERDEKGFCKIFIEENRMAYVHHVSLFIHILYYTLFILFLLSLLTFFIYIRSFILFKILKFVIYFIMICFITK